MNKFYNFNFYFVLAHRNVILTEYVILYKPYNYSRYKNIART